MAVAPVADLTGLSAAPADLWPALREAFRAWLDPDNFDGNGRQRTRLSDRTGPLLKQRG